MKKLLFTIDGKEYYVKGHATHRMKTRCIKCSDMETVITNPDKVEERGYATLFEGTSHDRLLRVYCRDKPTGYIEILTTYWSGNGNNKRTYE